MNILSGVAVRIYRLLLAFSLADWVLLLEGPGVFRFLELTVRAPDDLPLVSLSVTVLGVNFMIAWDFSPRVGA